MYTTQKSFVVRINIVGIFKSFLFWGFQDVIEPHIYSDGSNKFFCLENDKKELFWYLVIYWTLTKLKLKQSYYNLILES